jgi:tRNA nucleotidyltransferase/poly(A) polymerase
MDNRVIFQDIGTLAKKMGMEVFVVGGFVRDQLLGITSKKDIDVVVVGDALVLAKAFAEAMGEDRGTLVEFPDFFTARYVFTKTDEAGVKTKLMEVEFASATKPINPKTS